MYPHCSTCSFCFCSICSLSFKLSGIPVSEILAHLLALQQEISQSQHPVSDLDSPLCDDKVYHVCAPSVSSLCDTAAKGGANCQGISFLPNAASLAGTTLAMARGLLQPGPQKSFNLSRSIQKHIINQQLKV